MNEPQPLDLDALRAILADTDLADPETRARVLQAIPPELLQLASSVLGGHAQGEMAGALAGLGAGSPGEARGPFTVQHVDETSVPGMVLLDLPDDEILLITREKYAAGKRAIAEAIGAEYDELNLSGLRLMLDEHGVPILEPPTN